MASNGRELDDERDQLKVLLPVGGPRLNQAMVRSIPNA